MELLRLNNLVKELEIVQSDYFSVTIQSMVIANLFVLRRLIRSQN